MRPCMSRNHRLTRCTGSIIYYPRAAKTQRSKEAKTLIQSANFLIFAPICEGYQGVWHTSHYGDVGQRWLLVRSEQATKREHHNLNSRMLKQAERVARPSRNCASKRLPVALMPLQPLSNGRKTSHAGSRSHRA
jgi:hypothetical protein